MTYPITSFPVFSHASCLGDLSCSVLFGTSFSAFYLLSHLSRWGCLASSVGGEVSALGCFSVFEFVICSAIAIFMLLRTGCELRPLWCKFLILEVRVIGAVGELWWNLSTLILGG